MNQSIAARSAFFWLFQRVTGAFLAVFLFTHVKVLHWDYNFATRGLLDFSFVIERLQGNVGWLIFYFLFIVSALFHGLNGLWAVVLDFRPSRGVQLVWLTVLWAVGILTAYYAITTLRVFYRGGAA
jgi:succinate dehydrogenase / fumarate reductase membrane anchor subunit